MALIFRNDFYELHAEVGFLRLVRTARTYADLDEVRRTDDEVGQVMRARSPRETRLLFDLRGGPPGRNDPEFERVGVETRHGMAKLFSRVAILVKTAAGRLQVNRLTRDAHLAPGIFLDEREALTWLKEK
jgi:hypothetical protein